MRRIILSIAVLLMYVMTGTAQSLELSKKHGFYDSPFKLTITDSSNLATNGAKIYYTLDGSEPTAGSKEYTEPINISKSTVVRTAVIGADGLISKISTATYLFLDDILKQSDSPEGYPKQWGAYSTISGIAPADYGMDPEMTGNPTLAKKIKEGLTSLPVLSIVTDKNNLFSHDNDENTGGIYIFTGPPVGDPTGNGWTRAANAELFGCGHDFSVTCGLRLHGGHGRIAEKNPKHSMRLVFKKDYGEKTLKYPLFGEDEPKQFNQLVLRCHFGNAWQHWDEGNRQKAQYTRDVWARRIQRKMGWTSVNALYVHVFLNGMYWGLYNIAERVDDQYGKDHLGGSKSDIDVVKIEEEGGNHHEAAEGDLEAWDLMVNTAAMASDDTYYNMLQGLDADGNEDATMEKLLDIDNFIDYILINQYAGNGDWDHHNWYAIRRKGEKSQGFRFLCWDSEIIIDNPNANILNLNNGKKYPTGIFQNLLKNKRFSKRYMSRAKQLFAEDGYLGQKIAEEVWDSLYNNISTAIYAEAARWGDYRRDVHPYSSKGSLYTVDETYMKERNRLHTQFFPQRSRNILSSIERTYGTDDFEPLKEWIPFTTSFFHLWDKGDATAKLIEENTNAEWNMKKDVTNGGVVAGFSGVEHNRFADIGDYDKLIIKGKGGRIRILANRLEDHGEWKEINESLDANSKYWDNTLQCLVVPVEDLKTKTTSSNNTRKDSFVHLHAIKADWGNTININGIWLTGGKATAITPVQENIRNQYDGMYRNLNGQIVSHPSKGVYIYQGKKIVLVNNR